MRYEILLALALFADSSPALAEIPEDAEAWITLGAGGPISGKLLGNFEAIARFSNDEDGLYEAEFGGFLGYKVSKATALWVGYVRVPRYRRGGPTTVEDRIRQQVTADLGKVAGGSLSGRVRLEERFRDGGGVGLRLRPQVKFSLPLRKDGPAFVLSHESFITLNNTGWGQRKGFERMRNFVGVSTAVTKAVKAEIGYLNQYNTPPGGRDSIDHAGTLTLSYSF